MRAAGSIIGGRAAAAGRATAAHASRGLATTVGEMAQPGMAQMRTVTVLPGHGCVCVCDRDARAVPTRRARATKIGAVPLLLAAGPRRNRACLERD